MMTVDPKQRITITQALKHKWFKDYKEVDLYTPEERAKLNEEFSLDKFIENNNWINNDQKSTENRSEERRVGKEWLRLCTSRGSQEH